MSARRCSDCGLNFPTGNSRCLKCDGELDWMANADPMTESEANHVAFDVFYAKREAKRTAQLAGLEAAAAAVQSPPEQIGSA